MKKSVFAALVTAAALAAPFHGVYATTATEDAAQMCKVEAARQFSTNDDPVRVKFKMASGPRLWKHVFLQVIPDIGESYDALCKVDGRARTVVELTRQG